MSRLQELLRRFRPLVAPPGLAGPGAVPVDRTADLLAELAGVFAAIDRVEDQAELLEASARLEADERRQSGRLESARLTAEATQRAPLERASAYAARRATGDAAVGAELAAAEREALRIRAVAAARMPALVDAVLERLLGSSQG